MLYILSCFLIQESFKLEVYVDATRILFKYGTKYYTKYKREMKFKTVTFCHIDFCYHYIFMLGLL